VSSIWTSIDSVQDLCSNNLLPHSLRKEVLRLREENSALKTDLESVRENTQRLMEANVVAQESFSSLNEKAKEQRHKARSVESSYKQQIHDLQLAQEEMNDEIKMKQAAYIAEVRSKKQYEAALSQVVDLIHDRCRDSRLVEAVLHISDEVEEQQHHDPDDVTSVLPSSPPDDIQTKLSDSMVGRFASFFSSA
jgi:chromosome segregation ATPase